MTDSRDHSEPGDARPPDTDAGGKASLPEAEDLTRDRPALAKSEAKDNLPVAEPVAEGEIPVAEEVAPPEPPPARKATRTAPAAAPARAVSGAEADARPAETADDEAAAASADMAGPTEPAGPAEADARPRRHWGRWLLVPAGIVVILLVVFLPQILSLGAVRRYALGEVNRFLPVRVDAADWSLSWFGEQVVQDLDVRSFEDQRVARARRVTVETGLLDLVLEPRRIGPVSVVEAEVWVEDLRAALAGPPAEAPPEVPAEGPPTPTEPVEPPPLPPEPVEPPPLPEPAAPPERAEPGPPPVVPKSVEVDGLVLHVGGERVRVPQANLHPNGDRHTFTARLEMGDAKAQAGGTVEGTLTGLVTDWQGADRVGVEAVLACENLPLAPAVAAAGVAEAGLQVGGTVSGTATLARTREALVIAKVDLAAADLEVTGGPLGADRPAVETLRLQAEATWDRGAVTVRTLRVTSPVAMARASGTFGLASAEAPPSGKGSAEVRLDLARLAGMFHHTLGLHEGLDVEAGSFEATVDAVSAEAASRVRVIASLQDLRGRRHGDLLTLSPLYLDTVLVREHAVAKADVEPDADPEAEPEDQAAAAGEDEAGPPPAPLSGDWLALADTLRVESFVFSGAFGAVEAAGRLSHLVVDADLDVARAGEEVGRFVDLRGWGGAGAASVHLETGRSLEGDITASGRATLRDLRLDLPGGGRLDERRATLSAETVLRLDAQQRLAAIEPAAFTLEAQTASVKAEGTLRRTGEVWRAEGHAAGNGTVANLAGVAAVFLQRMQREPADKDPAEPSPAPSSADRLLAFCRRASGADGTGAEGTWNLALDVGGTSGQAIALKADGAVADVRLPAETDDGEPFRLQEGTLAADVLFVPGETSAVTLNAFAVTAPGAALQVQGPTTVAIGGPTTRIKGPATATVTANLPALAAMLRPLDLVPADLTAAGDVKVTLAVTPVTDAPTKVDVAVRGEQIDLAWADGRQYTDPLPRATAVGTLDRDDAGEVRVVEVTEWSVATVAGAIQGTARGKPTADGWAWDLTAAGDGSIQPLAHTTARLLGSEPRTLGGMWHLKASFAGRDRRLQADLGLTDLALPGQGDPPGPPVRLEDVRLEVAASVGEERQVQVQRARVSGPGIQAEVSGTARLPTRDNPHPRADGQVKAAVALADAARVLRPFGFLAEEDRLAGHADFEGEVRTDATGLGGSGTLSLSELEVHLAEGGSTFREDEARLPIAFAYVNETKRWEVAATGMSAVTVHGSWRVAVQPDEQTREAEAAREAETPEKGEAADEKKAPPRLEVTCDLAFDGERVRHILGTALPDTIRMAGPYHAKAHLAGPLPAEGPWHTRLVAMEGDGEVEVNRLTYATLTGGEGTVRWKLAGGVLDLSPDPDRPSRLRVADGTVTLPGRIDLRGPQARLVVKKETRVVEDLPLAGREVREYIKYASPVLAASVEASGRLTLDVQRLDLPLGEGASEKAAGDLRYHIDEFQTELMGPLGQLVQAVGAENRSVTQTLGPVEVALRDGVFTIPEHRLRYTEEVSLSFGGRIGLDKQMKVTVGVPVTRPLMQQYKVSERAMPYLEDVVLAVPLEGTIDNPQIDNRALGKRLGELALEAIKREALKHLGEWLKGGER